MKTRLFAPVFFALCFALAGDLAAQEIHASHLHSVELARKVVPQERHVLTLVRIAPPALPKATPALLARLSVEEQLIADRRSAKTYAVITVQAQTYFGERTLTLLSWQTEAGSFRAVSNVDFRLFSRLREWESATHVFLWMPFVLAMPADSEKPPEELLLQVRSSGLEFGLTKPDYALLDAALKLPGDDPVLRALDHAHALAATDRDRLDADRKADETAAALQDQFLALPQPRSEITLHYWPLKR